MDHIETHVATDEGKHEPKAIGAAHEQSHLCGAETLVSLVENVGRKVDNSSVELHVEWDDSDHSQSAGTGLH